METLITIFMVVVFLWIIISELGVGDVFRPFHRIANVIHTFVALPLLWKIAIETILIIVTMVTVAICGSDSLTMSSLIMVEICVPMAQISTRLAPWVIEYLCSRNNSLRARIRPWLVTTPFLGDEYLNTGISRIGTFFIWALWGIVALIFGAFPRLAQYVLMYVVAIVTSAQHLLSGASGRKLALLWVILTLAVMAMLAILWVHFRDNVVALSNGERAARSLVPNIIALAVLWIIRKLYCYWYYQLPITTALVDMTVQAITLAIIAGVIWLSTRNTT